MDSSSSDQMSNEKSSPAGDKSVQRFVVIFFRAVNIGAALIPDCAANRIGDETVEHLIVEHGRVLMASERLLLGRESGRLRRLFALRERVLVGGEQDAGIRLDVVAVFLM